jgi:hypothetical protein
MAKETRTAPARLTTSYVPGMGLLKKYRMATSRHVKLIIRIKAADEIQFNKLPIALTESS